MILTVAGFLTTLGFVTWLVGLVFEYQGVATIGGVIVLGVGVMVTADGLEYRTGEIQTEPTANTTDVQYQYKTVQMPTRMPLGILTMLLGGAFVLRALDPDSGGL